MVWIYLQESGESHFPLKNGYDQLHIAKLNPIAKVSSCKECKRGICPKHQYGMILQHSETLSLIQDLSICQSTLSTVAFPAKISLLQELEKAWRESEADYFSRSCAWPKKSSPSSYSLKMSQQSPQEADFKSLVKLPRWGMIVDGVCYPLQKPERGINVSGGSYWPTPQARAQSDTLSERRRHTPCLETQVKMIATPTSSQASKPINRPCPSAETGNHGETTQQSIGRLNPEHIGKKLSTQWTSVLMGYPPNWTELI